MYKITTIVISVALLFVLWYYVDKPERVIDRPKVSEIISDTTSEELNEWDMFVDALIWVESRGRTDAVGKTNDKGILQITPIYVEDANRILGYDKFTHDDAFSVERSLEMFNIIQSHYNPSKCVQKAIKLHNPRAGSWYSKRIFDRIDIIRTKRL